jgi:molybdenum cofactor cytidylyltransferase
VPIVRIVVRNAIQSQLDEVILVTGFQSDDVVCAVGELGQRVVRNPNFEHGQSVSMRAGLAAVSPDAEAVVFLLGDQPEVGHDVIDALIAEFRRSGAAIVQPIYGSTPANPLLFGREMFTELNQVTGDQGARAIVRRRGAGVHRVQVSDGSPPGDVDTDEDYQALLKRWARRKVADR